MIAEIDENKHSVHMVFVVVTTDDDAMPPFIWLNTKAYIKCLEELVLPWIEKAAAGRPYVLLQKSAPWRKTQCWPHHLSLPRWLSPWLLFLGHGWAKD